MAKFLIVYLGSGYEPVVMQANSLEDLLVSQQFIEYLQEEDLIPDDENPLDDLGDLRIYSENFELQKLPKKKLVKTFVLEDV